MKVRLVLSEPERPEPHDYEVTGVWRVTKEDYGMYLISGPGDRIENFDARIVISMEVTP